MKLTIPLICLVGFLLVATASAQTSSFTYQGRLSDAMAVEPTNGLYDFRFALFDSGNIQIGGTLTRTNVQVTGGVFTVTLDFGTNPFAAGADRFIEISVKRAVDPSYLVLAPRQQLTSAPYALQSFNAANLGGVAASQYVQTDDVRLSDARTPTAGSNNYIQNGIAVQGGAFFSIAGTGTAASFSANFMNVATQYNIGGTRMLSIGGSGNLFLGTNTGLTNTGSNNTFVGMGAGTFNTSGTQNAFFGKDSGPDNTTGNFNTFLGASSGGNNTTGSSNVFIGRLSGLTNTTGTQNTLVGDNTNLGAANLSFATAIGANAMVSTSNTVQLGRANGGDTVFVPGMLDLGLLGGAGAQAICRNASGQISTCSSSLRYKTNVVTFADGLDLIHRLRPVTFDWKTDSSHDLGLVAEEVAKVSRLLVTHNADGEIEGVKYDRVAVVLVNAVKEQQAMIERQQREIADLKTIVCLLKPEAPVCENQK